jgi:hypothetical protein
MLPGLVTSPVVPEGDIAWSNKVSKETGRKKRSVPPAAAVLAGDVPKNTWLPLTPPPRTSQASTRATAVRSETAEPSQALKTAKRDREEMRQECNACRELLAKERERSARYKSLLRVAEEKMEQVEKGFVARRSGGTIASAAPDLADIRAVIGYLRVLIHQSIQRRDLEALMRELTALLEAAELSKHAESSNSVNNMALLSQVSSSNGPTRTLQSILVGYLDAWPSSAESNPIEDAFADLQKDSQVPTTHLDSVKTTQVDKIDTTSRRKLKLPFPKL